MKKRVSTWHMMAGVTLATVFGLPFGVHPALAQTINYGEMELLFGEPVTINATGKPQKASESPVAVEIVSADQIRRMGVTSIPEILNRVSGLTNWQATRFSGDVGVRGQNASYNKTLLVLLNGRQVYIDINGYTDWTLIPVQLEEIRQIEVVKEPTTALYGFNAVSGVVNIITYNPLYTDEDQVGAVAGTGEYGRVYGVNTAQLSDKTSVRVSAGIEGGDEFAIRSKTNYSGNFRDEARNRKIMADSMTQVSDDTQLRLQVSHADSTKTDAFYRLYSELTEERASSAQATLISDTSVGQVQANLYTNIYQEEFGGNFNAKVDNQVVVAQLSDLFQYGTDHTFRLQGELRHNSAKGATFFGPGAKVAYDLAAAGGMWNWAITPDLEWTNALRVDHLMLYRSGPFSASQPFSSNDEFDQSVTDYSFNTGAVWKATALDTFRASIGRGIGAPSLGELGIHYIDLSSVAPPVVVAGNPQSETTIVNHYELGYSRFIGGIDGKFTSSLFYKNTEKISGIATSSRFTGGTVIVETAEFGNSETAGLELGLKGKIGQEWTWDTSYAYQNTIDDIAGVTATTTPYNLRYENTIPHHVLKGHLGYATGPWETDLYGEITSDFDATVYNGNDFTIVPLDGYYTLGGRVGYTFENDLTLALMGSELAQARVTNNYGLENERRIFVQVSKPF